MAHILLAEDDAEDRFMMLQAFKDIGHANSLSCVEDGSQVVDYLEASSEEVTLVVLDLNMPLMNGTEALKQLKAHPVYNSLPVIVFSTSINEQEKQRTLDLGAEAYLVKPSTYSAYLETCKRFLSYPNR